MNYVKKCYKNIFKNFASIKKCLAFLQGIWQKWRHSIRNGAVFSYSFRGLHKGRPLQLSQRLADGVPDHQIRRQVPGHGGFVDEHQLLPGAGGGGLLGQVVGGGPQAPCHNQQAAAGDGRLHRMAQALHIVPHHGGVQQVDAQPRELLGHNGRIQIDHLAQQQLGAHRNNLSVHLGSSFSDCSWSRGSAGSPKNREP